jgi:hypothetical protein
MTVLVDAMRAITLLFLPARVDSHPTSAIDGSGSIH